MRTTISQNTGSVYDEIEMITFWSVRFTFVVYMYVSHTVNVLVTDIILNITSQKHLKFTLLHIGSRLFELFSKETIRNAFNLIHNFQPYEVHATYLTFKLYG